MQFVEVVNKILNGMIPLKLV